MQAVRWLCITAQAYLATIAYALLLGIAYFLISPESVAQYQNAAEASLSATLRYAGLNAAYGGLLLAPPLGFWILRDTNASVQRPDQESNWWRRSHLLMAKTLVAIACIGAVVGLLEAIVRGSDWISRRSEFAYGLAAGSAIGAFAAAFRAVIGALSDRAE